MTSIDNGYKRFQNYQKPVNKSNLKKDFIEQNYKTSQMVEKTKENAPKLGTERTVLEKATKLGVNRQEQFFRK